MTTRAVVDCTPTKDALGRAVTPTTTYPDLTQAELDQRTADLATAVSLQVAIDTALLPRSAVGRITLALIDGVTKAVSFGKTLHSADYVVMLNPTASLAASLWTTAHTATGFTLNLSVAIAGTIEYHAQEVS